MVKKPHSYSELSRFIEHLVYKVCLTRNIDILAGRIFFYKFLFKLIQNDPTGKDSYIEGKTDLVNEILDKSGFVRWKPPTAI